MSFERLSRDVLPRRYILTLQPDCARATFSGEETIEIVVATPVRRITLHAKDLDIRSAAIVKGDAAGAGGVLPLAIARVRYQPAAETLTFDFPRALARGTHRLHIVFRGRLNDGLRGFYRSAYQEGSRTRYIATTQFEATDARRAFPCFDEPALKAVFEVSLVLPKNEAAISNTLPAKEERHAGASGLKKITFAPTPKMSTYLLAFIVGDFQYIEKRTPEGVLVRVWATRGKQKQGTFALDFGARTLSFFNKYFKIPYPLPVLNMIAIPDFEAAAMENWGAVTFRESVLLFDEKNSSTQTKQRIAMVLAHELAHQWFGNLVTMEWWTHLWLNEGFASYIEYVAVDHIFPEWRIWNEFVSYDFGEALRLDALKNTHPIEVEVHDPGEINEIFDAVSYSKGASAIRMLADYLGADMFRDGLRYYLKKHAYGNAETPDLWRALEKASGKPVTRMMATWTGMPGYPLLTVARASRGMQVRQSRFFGNGKGAASTQWMVPVHFVSDKQPTRKTILLSKRTAALSLPAGAIWFKLNAGETALFRSDYPHEVWQAFAAPIQKKEIEVLDRLGLMRDMAALAEAGTRSMKDAIIFSQAYRDETEYVVWAEVAAVTSRIRALIAQESFADAYRDLSRDLFVPIAKKMGWAPRPRESHEQKLLRTLVLSQAGYYGDAAVILHAKKLFSTVNAARPDRNRIPADQRGVVYGLAAQYGGPTEHAKLLKMYAAAVLHEEKNRIGAALGRFQNEEILQRTLHFAISKAVRVQDAASMLAVVWRNPAGQKISWEFFKKNWALFVSRYSEGHTMSRVVMSLSTFNAVADIADAEHFFKKNKVPQAAVRAVKQALEQARSNAAWLARDRKELREYFLNFP